MTPTTLPQTLPSVSVIVALHNPGPLLADFLDQAAALSEVDGVDVVIIDDFSRDGSRDTLREWATPAGCTVDFNAKNLGVALTRNRALEIATGEFVWFIDHDDSWSSEGLDILRAHAAGVDAVIGCADYQYGERESERRRIEQAPSAPRIDGAQAARLLLEGSVQGFLWTKLFRREIMGAHPFPEQRSQSDIVGVARSLAAAEDVACVDRVVYTYVRREGSITRSKSPSLESLENARDSVISATRESALPGQIDFFVAWFYCLAVVKTAVRWRASPEAVREAVDSAAQQARQISLRSVLRASPRIAGIVILLRTVPRLLPPLLTLGFLLLDASREVRGRIGRVARKFLGFSMLPAITALIPIITIPAITSTTGAAGWVAVAIGQSVGGVGAVVVELGWSAMGSQRVSRQSHGNARQNAALALTLRLVVSLPIAALSGVIAALISPEHAAESAGVAMATALAANNLVWFFVGIGKPRLILFTDALPRAILALVSVWAVYATGSLWPYVITLLVANLASVFLGSMALGLRPRHMAGFTVVRMLVALRFHTVVLTARLLSATYIVLPTTLVSLVSPSSVAVFSAADRLQRMALNALSSLPNTFQSWVGKNQRDERVRRSFLAIAVNTGFGIVAGTLFALFAPWLSHVLFSGVATVEPAFAVVCGFIILTTCISRTTGGIMLPALGRMRALTVSAASGLVVGVPTILIGASLFGAAGALIGALISEVTVLTVQIIAIRGALSSRKKD
ncbi:glycosyltransferase [Mycetocola tolaasinivorans]|uniref:Glycosyltransferase n=1 Tax=Mycetocola tolaasinivorans TaxID=76635 RepID=A0A3L7ABM5_9MICO|nr:glycosyltransferase [Mycetocola tolaasinivorans]RLP77809.1 glycosyltransferase [Mycetocola tolaasinivorans]